MARFLVLPGDVRFNFGDTAILHGVVALVRSVDPAAEIVVASVPPLLAGGLEEVRFAGSGAGALRREAARADLVLWGGGQLLQGNRSRLKLPWQAARLTWLRANGAKAIVGVGQGVGPLPRASDRRIAAHLVRGCRTFSVRDDASRSLLEESGVAPGQVVVTADPALLLAPEAAPEPPPGRARLRIGLAPRFTAHHGPGRIVPFQRRSAPARREILGRAGWAAAVEGWIAFADRIGEELGAEILVVPTYPAPWETDGPLAEAIAGGVRRPADVTVLRPRTSVEEIGAACRGLDALVAVPMHAAILAAGQRCPTLVAAYEPKGEAFAAAAGLPVVPGGIRFEAGQGPDRVFAGLAALLEGRDRVRTGLDRSVREMRLRAAASREGIEKALLGRV